MELDRKHQRFVIEAWESLNKLSKRDCDFTGWLQLKLSCSRTKANAYANWFFASPQYAEWRAKEEGRPAPLCEDCGAQMIPDGAAWRCSNCRHQSGGSGGKVRRSRSRAGGSMTDEELYKAVCEQRDLLNDASIELHHKIDAIESENARLRASLERARSALQEILDRDEAVSKQVVRAYFADKDADK